MEKEYTPEQAERIILECEGGIIDLVSIDPKYPGDRDKYKYVMASEEYWVERETDSLGYRVVDEFMKSEVKEYATEYPFDFDDKDEEKLREVYFKYNKKDLNKKQLVKGLVEAGYTEKEAEELVKKYATVEIREEEKENWNLIEQLFRRPKYKPLKHHENKRIVKRIVEGTSEDFVVTEIPDCYEIMQIEEWLLEEYEDLTRLRPDGEYIYGTERIPFRTIRRILRDSEEEGRNLTYSELKQRIIKECSATGEEAEMAIYGALRTFKIREAITPRGTRSLEPSREAEYYWSGTTCKYPPLTLQDKILNPIKEVFIEAERQEKEKITHKELLRKTLETYKKYEEDKDNETYTKKVSIEYVEMMIEDAEELLLITAKKENGETKYSFNHQILKNTTNQNTSK